MSRQPSGRGASAGRPARPGVFVQAPKSDIYVALLGVALGAMVIGCILLALVLNRYEWKVKAAARSAPAPALVASATENFSTVRL